MTKPSRDGLVSELVPHEPSASTGRGDLIRCLVEQGDRALGQMAAELGMSQRSEDRQKARPTAKLVELADSSTRADDDGTSPRQVLARRRGSFSR